MFSDFFFIRETIPTDETALEKLRKRLIAAYYFRNIFCAVLFFTFVVSVLALSARYNIHPSATLLLLFPFFIFAFYWQDGPQRFYGKAYRDLYKKALGERLGLKDIEFKKGTIPLGVRMSSYIVPDGRSEDDLQIIFDYHGAKLTLSFNSFYSSEEEKTHFSGTFALLEFSSPLFTSLTFVIEDVGFLGKITKEKLTDFKRVDLVDPDFEKKFDVFTEDPVEARMILHPAFIEKYKALSERYHPLSVSFFDGNKVLMTIPTTHTFFSANLFSPVQNGDTFSTACEEIFYILMLVDAIFSGDFNRKRRIP